MIKTDRKTLLKIGGGIFLLYLCIYYWPAVSGFISTVAGAAFPLLLGGIIAYVINILMAFYERHWFPHTEKRALIRSRRGVCLILALITLCAIIALVIGLVLPQLISCVSLIVAEAPGVIAELIAWLDRLEFMPEDIISALKSIDWQSKIGDLAGILSAGVGNVMNVLISTVTAVFSGVVSTFLALIFAIYLLLSKDRLSRQVNRVMTRYLKEPVCAKIHYFAEILDDCFRRYIVGQCTEAAILGGLCVLGMWLLRLPYATMIGALIAFTALIPVAGAYIGGCIGAFMILTVSPVKAIIFVVFLIVLQQIEGNLIYPRVVGNSIGLPALWVLAAITVGGGVLGIGGMLLAVPLTATLWRILRNDLDRQSQ